MVYSAGRLVVCLSVCYFVLVFFSPFSIAITSLGEKRARLGAFRAFVRFVLVWVCRFPLPLGVWEGLRFVIVALPGLFSDLFFNIPTESWEQIAQDRTKWRGLIKRGAGEYEAKRISEAKQKCAQRKARAKASPTELSSSDLSCSICNRQFRAKIGLISHLRTHK